MKRIIRIGQRFHFIVWFYCIAVLFFIPAISLWAECKPSSDTAFDFQVRFSVADQADFSAIFNNPKSIENLVYEQRFKGEYRVVAETDFHAVYPIELRFIEQVIKEIDDQENISPSIAESRLICSSTVEQYPYFRQRLLTKFSFLVFTATYENILNIFYELPPDNTFRVKFTLDDSIDGQMLRSCGSWYLEPVFINGEKHTYFRYYNMNMFTEEPTGLRFALEHLLAGQIRKTLEGVYEEAMARKGEI
jgi:hypothetical protein